MRKQIWVSSLALLLAAGASFTANAQEDEVRGAQTNESDDNGEWGWLGLLGLAGLAGLKRRDRTDHVTHGHASAR